MSAYLPPLKDVRIVGLRDVDPRPIPDTSDSIALVLRLVDRVCGPGSDVAKILGLPDGGVLS